MYVLGISAFYHDSAACLIKNGNILAASQEERFTRIKHDQSFPSNSISFCLKEAGIKLSDVEIIAFYDKPFLKFDRLIETYLAFAPKGFLSFSKSIPIWVKDKVFQKNNIINELKKIDNSKINFNNKLIFSEHHLSHAASAFYPSPFEEAVILTMDGVGEWTTTSLAIGYKEKISILKEIHFPHSLGLLYSAFTYYTGFKVNSGEYKLMGLAPYGNPKYVNKIRDNLIDIKSDGSFHLDMSYFNYCTGLTMTNQKFDRLFGGPRREPESKITSKEMDLAASIQKITEEIVILLAKDIRNKTKARNLCLAGGVALNCVANGVLVKENIFENVWIQPAAGDAGGALGAAFSAYYLMLKKERKINSKGDIMKGSYLGPSYTDNEIENSLIMSGGKFEKVNNERLINLVAKYLSEGNAIGLLNGRMEFGPRALGGRSIIADPRSSKMQKTLNMKVKYRESFRPFAPSILREDLDKWFDLDCDSPYMLLVACISNDKKIPMTEKELELFGIEKLNIPRSSVPAITHVDYSARIQTVHKNSNPFFYAILKKFKDITGCPILVNTSFNVRGEPIVCSPKDAFKCFMGTELDYLVIENFLLSKKNQDKSLYTNYEDKYELD
tara:strand:- start:1989 stop:3827 length:1839 start_codon:yes stop_codon:yes gene_type:complete